VIIRAIIIDFPDEMRRFSESSIMCCNR